MSLLKYLFRKEVSLPLTLQMPITSRCNSRCKTCNVWKHKTDKDIDSDALKKALQNPFFAEVRSVGLNGGEFTLVPNFIQILEAVLTLPKIANIYLITNGLFPQKLFEYLQLAKHQCDKKGVVLHICLSVDGFGKVHEEVRGVPHCFEKTQHILQELYTNKENYCHSFSVGCTLSRHNIAFIRETEAYLNSYEGLNVEYHLAVPNRRIKTFSDYQDYYVMNHEESRRLATEFFYCKYLSANDESYRRQCFANYYFLSNKGKGRLCTCEYLHRDVTIDENLNMALCATASDIIGNLNELSATTIINNNKTKQERKQLRKNCCDSCIHYSYHPLTIRGRWAYIQEEIKNKYILRYYDVRSDESLVKRFKGTCSLSGRIVYNYLKLIYRLIWKLQ